jgi:hypothetical protein
LGRQFYSDNAKAKNNHLNYNYSVVQNIINMAELEKMQLVIELGTNDNAFYRFQKVPVVIYEHSAQKKSIVDLKDERLKEVGMQETHFDGAKQDPQQNPNEAGENANTAKINDLAVTTAKIDNLAVTDAKINDVNGTKLVGAYVTNDRLALMAYNTIKGNRFIVDRRVLIL